ncbi:MAG: metal-dependent hydrolase [Nocardioidaceae bacterium]|nr:metal-dependent hydrolase [Nocardioidaceae bacterium]
MRRALEQWWTRAAGLPWLPLALVVVILVLDAVSSQVPFHVLWTGLLDEPAHLATTAVVLLALAPRWCARHPGLSLVALAASTLIDVDHVPLFLGVDAVAASSMSRPFSHALLTPLVLLVVAALWVRARPVLAAAAAGVCLHFVRDLGTGSGLPLLWPLSSTDVAVSYPVYVVALAVVAGYRLVGPARPSRARPVPRATSSVG